MDIYEAIHRLRLFIPAGETEWFTRASLPDLLTDPDLLAATGHAHGPSVTFAFEGVDGQHPLAKLTATPERVQWVILNGDAPIWLQNDAEALRTVHFADGSV